MNGEKNIDFDVAIVGGGIVGLAFARLLTLGCGKLPKDCKIALIESHPPQSVPRDADIDLRVSAIAPASRAVMQRMGIWEQLPSNLVSSYERMCVWQAAGSAGQSRSISFSAAELGEPDLGHVTENRAMRMAAWEQLQAESSVTFIDEQSIGSIVAEGDCCRIDFADKTTVSARLVVGADGANSLVREQMGVHFRQHSYRQSAIVCHLASEQPHLSTAWQRFLPGGPVALLPLADGRSSLVWSCPDDEAKELMHLDDEEFAGRLTAATDGVLGALKCASKRASFPLAAGYAEQFTGHRFALIGDAAHRVHPLAGQGVNLGLLDAASLAEHLSLHLRFAAADAGDPLVLRRYERERKGDNLLTLGMMDIINRLFSGSGGELGGMALGAVDKLTPLKTKFARYAIGHGRALPAAARPTG